MCTLINSDIRSMSDDLSPTPMYGLAPCACFLFLLRDANEALDFNKCNHMA
jgi:hypothetical protein